MKINRKRILWMLLGVIFILSGCAKREEAPQTVERPQVKTKAEKSEEEPAFGAVPYFKDDTGRDAQLVDDYLYGYWAGKLCRYNVKNNYQEETNY